MDHVKVAGGYELGAWQGIVSDSPWGFAMDAVLPGEGKADIVANDNVE